MCCKDKDVSRSLDLRKTIGLITKRCVRKDKDVSEALISKSTVVLMVNSFLGIVGGRLGCKR